MLWSWNKNNDEDWRNGTFETKEQAIYDAISNTDKGEGFYIGQCEMVQLPDSIGYDILEDLAESYCSESGCDYDIYDGVEKEHKEWLETEISRVINDFHGKAGIEPCWFKVLATEYIDTREEPYGSV